MRWGAREMMNAHEALEVAILMVPTGPARNALRTLADALPSVEDLRHKAAILDRQLTGSHGDSLSALVAALGGGEERECGYPACHCMGSVHTLEDTP